MERRTRLQEEGKRALHEVSVLSRMDPADAKAILWARWRSYSHSSHREHQRLARDYAALLARDIRTEAGNTLFDVIARGLFLRRKHSEMSEPLKNLEDQIASEYARLLLDSCIRNEQAAAPSQGARLGDRS